MLTRVRELLSASRGSADRDAGFTLIEMLVTMLVFGMLGAIVLAISLTSLKTSRTTQNRVVGTDQAQQATERMARDLRSADPLVTATANDMSAKVYRNGHCEIHRWYLGATGALLQDTQKYAASTTCATATGTPSTAVTTTLVTKVDNTAATPLFTFARWDTTANPPALQTMSSPVPAANVPLVDRINVVIDVYQPESHADVVVQSAVDLRNVVTNS